MGRTITVNDLPMRVIGVAPAGFTGPDLQKETEIWTPTVAFLTAIPGLTRNTEKLTWLQVLGRLKEGTSLEASSAWLEDASPQIEAALPPRPVGRTVVYSLQDGSAGVGEWRGKLNSPLWILMAAVTLVLLIACANLANLFLARMNDRTQEFAIKQSIGIGRWRLISQLLVETLLLVSLGEAAALALASGLTRFVLALHNEGPNRPLELLPDHASILYLTSGCLFIVLVAGLYPAWRASRTEFSLAPATKFGHGFGRSLTRRTLIVIQVALAVVLLFGTVLFARSLRNLRTIELGYSSDRILSVEVTRVDPRAGSKENEPLVLADLLASALQLPEVESAAYSNIGVLTGRVGVGRVEVTSGEGEKAMLDNVYTNTVGSEYFATLGTPLLRGREFNMSDWKNGSSVVIVNETFANKAWPDQDPIGKQVGNDANVIGLVADSKYANVREDALPVIYRPFEKFDMFGGTIQLRFRGSATALERELEQLITAAAPDFEISESATIEALRERGISQDRLLSLLSSLFGLLGGGLALVGIYGLISYSVAQRRHEIGVRVSVGARRSQIVRLVLREARALVVLGVAVGVPIALVLSTWLESLLFEVTPSDPLYIASTLGILLLGGMAAAYLPVLRATRIDPLKALKAD